MVSSMVRIDRHQSGRPLALRLYLVGAIVLGISALYGGAVLMVHRASEPLGMPLEWLEHTPFRDYFVPGLTLFGVFGIGSFAVVFGLLQRRRWAGVAAVGLGIAQVIWIVVEAAWLRMVHPLHVVYGGLGAVLAVLATRQSVHAYLSAGARGDDR